MPGTQDDVRHERDEVTHETANVMQFFTFLHLPAHLQEVSKQFSDLADHIIGAVPRNRERTKALDLLLQAKDAAVRSAVAK